MATVFMSALIVSDVLHGVFASLVHSVVPDEGQPSSSLARALDHSDAFTLEFHINVSNLGEHLKRPTQDSEWARWVVLLSKTTTDLAECGNLCAQ